MQGLPDDLQLCLILRLFFAFIFMECKPLIGVRKHMNSGGPVAGRPRGSQCGASGKVKLSEARTELVRFRNVGNNGYMISRQTRGATLFLNAGVNQVAPSLAVP